MRLIQSILLSKYCWGQVELLLDGVCWVLNDLLDLPNKPNIGEDHDPNGPLQTQFTVKILRLRFDLLYQDNFSCAARDLLLFPTVWVC